MGQLKLLLICAVALPVLLESQAEALEIQVAVGQTVQMALPRQPEIIDVEDPTIAKMKLTSGGYLLVTGLKVGRTRIVGRYVGQSPILIPVIVTPPKSSG